MKQHLFLLGLSLCIVVGTLATIANADDRNQDQVKQESVEVSETVQRNPLEMVVTLQRQYMDGNVKEETHTETIWAMEDFWAFYDGWQVVNQSDGEITFKKQIPDISPYMKENGYFGLYNDVLSIFDGRPNKLQVIQSFYQIDTSELESYQIQQLQQGIKIDSKEVYQYVLEAYRGMEPARSVSS